MTALDQAYRLIARTYLSVMATRWGSYLLSKVFPAVFFLWIFLLGAPKVLDQAIVVFSRPQLELVELLVWLNGTAGWLFFSGLLVALYVLRKPVVGRASSLKGAVVALAGTYVGNLGASAVAATPPQWLALLASALGIVAGWLFWTSLLWLGRCFGIFPEARGLVTSGPYSAVRHPVYLSEMLMGLSVVLSAANLWSSVVYVAFVLLQYRRALYEEAALAEAFPAAYEAYRRRTRWRLVPGVV